MKETSLSEKIIDEYYSGVLKVCDVRGAVLRLKKAITHEDGTPCLLVKEIIDDIFGDKLTETEGQGL